MSRRSREEGPNPTRQRRFAQRLGGYVGDYDNIHPHQHGRYEEGRRTHAEKKYMRPR